MTRFLSLLFLTLFTATTVLAGETPPLNKILADRVHGKADAPVSMIEYASLTCSHCADFATRILPELEKHVEAGTLKIIYRDFPLDGVALRAAALARCLPEERYFAFIKMLFQRQTNWAHSKDPVQSLTQMAALAGLSPDIAKACMSDMKILEALTEQRTKAAEKYKIESTPTFIFNDGAERINGTRDLADYTAIIQKLAKKPVTAAKSKPETKQDIKQDPTHDPKHVH